MRAACSPVVNSIPGTLCTALGGNHIVFSTPPDRAYVSQDLLNSVSVRRAIVQRYACALREESPGAGNRDTVAGPRRIIASDISGYRGPLRSEDGSPRRE
jgi:hypothetical protein